MSNTRQTQVFHGKAQSFAALDFVSNPVAEGIYTPVVFTIASQAEVSSPLLEARIAAMIQHWKGLTSQVREEIRIFGHKSVEARQAVEESEMIDAFLTQVPRLSRRFRLQGSQNASEAPQTVHDSIVDDDELVTETLARLHLKQGNKERARGIYQQLMLIFPERSGYFADLIEQIS